MVLPYAALEVMKLRLTPSAYQQAVGLAKPFAGEAALAAGWVDKLVAPEQVLARATEAAHEFAKLPAKAHYGCKIRGREQTLEAIKTAAANVHKGIRPGLEPNPGRTVPRRRDRPWAASAPMACSITV